MYCNKTKNYRKSRGDFQGYLTYINYQGCSTINLVLESKATWTLSPTVQYLSILDLTLISDQKQPVLVKLYKNNISYFEICNSHNEEPHKKPVRYKWQENCNENFTKVLQKEVEILPNIKDKNNTKDNLKNNNNNSYNKNNKYWRFLWRHK